MNGTIYQSGEGEDTTGADTEAAGWVFVIGLEAFVVEGFGLLTFGAVTFGELTLGTLGVAR
ncbi:hypothetical protein [Thalassospira sp. MBR-102]|uniref:hypothetical protein n=1 Tax=Thalassospira sp. MBR-102 TaxID=3156466 RepID=UPI003391BC91